MFSNDLPVLNYVFHSVMICKYMYFILDAFPSDMTRQYKTMQTEMGLRIHKLETDLLRTRQLLGYN